MGNTLSCLASSSSENENAMDISPVLEMIQDVSQVDDLISLIEERLKAIVNAMNKPQQGSTNTSAQETASSSKLPYFIKFGKDLLEKVLKNTHGRGGKKRFMSRVDRVTRKVINDVTKELAKSHLIAAGLSAVVYVLDQIELVSMNKNQCVMLLMYMCALAKRIKQLDEHLPHEKEKLTEAIKFIVEGSLMCVGQMKSHYLSRFFSASVEAADLQSVESQILHIYPDLTLAAIISILERTPVLLPASQGEDFLAVGIEEARDKVIELLNMGINYMSTTAVVLYGVGGIGKTTLAAFVFKELDLSGYKFCRLDIEQNCSVHDLKMLQKQILLDLFGKNIDLRSCVEGNQQLTQAFRESKQPLFMFIDNALRGSDLAKILPHDLSCLPQDTRILITTRKLNETDLLLHPHIQRRGYSVDCLSEAKSLELLCEKALGSPDSKFPPNVDIDGLVKICGGMPLVLEIVGSKLKRYVNDVSGCNEMVEKLKKSLIEGEGEISERVVDVVYNTLDDDCKQAFLDIACFFYNWRRRIVAYTVGKVELQALEDAALVKSYSEEKEYTYNEYSTLSRFMSNLDNEEGILKVHDIVKARGRRLSQSQRVTDMQPLADAVQNTQKPQKIKWIELCSKIPVLEAEHLDRINSSLRVIYAPGLKINGTCTRSFENLRYVDVGKSDLPMDLNKLKRLSVLSCAGIKDNVCELPVSLQLLRPSRVSNLPALVENLGNLLSLEEVDIEALDWKIKRTLVSLPRSFCQLKSLRFLNLSSTYLNALPENFGSLPALQAMCLEYCSQLASLPANFGQLRSLRFLNMRRCRELVTLPDSFGNLSALQQLCLKECVKLMSLPPTFGQLSSLVYLDLGETKKKNTEERDYVGLNEVSSSCKIADKCGGCEDGDLKLSLDLSLWVGKVEKKHNVGQPYHPDSIGTMQRARILTKREFHSTDICSGDRGMINGLIGVKRSYNEAIVSNAQQRGRDGGVSTGITPDIGQTRQLQCSAPSFLKKNEQENPGIDRNKANYLSFHRNTCSWSPPFAMTQSGMDLANGLCNLSQDKADRQLSGSEPHPVADEPLPTINQAIGWPPIRAHRRNSLGSHPKSSGEKQAIGWPPIRAHRRNSLGSNPKPFGENQGTQSNSRYVKVNMDGVAIGRKVDLNAHESYEALVQDLENMFQPSTENQTGSQTSVGIQHGASSGSMSLRLLDPTSDMVLTYEDKEGDCMLVGDIPWKMFVGMVKRLRIMKTPGTNVLA